MFHIPSLSAMDIGDIMFRAALVTAVITLAGVFAYNVGLDEDGSDETAEALSSSLSNIFYSMLSWKEGSTASILFDSDGSGVNSFPDTIEGETYEVKVLPGSILLEFRGRYYPVIETPSIVPSRPSEGPGNLNRSISREISRAYGGFAISTPCTLNIEIYEIPEGSTLFIWPDTEMDHKGEIEELDRLFEESGQVIEGWETSVRFSADNVMVNGRILLFLDELPNDIKGTAGTPYLLPATTDLSALIDPAPQKYVVRKFAKEQYDGTFLIETSIHTA